PSGTRRRTVYSEPFLDMSPFRPATSQPAGRTGGAGVNFNMSGVRMWSAMLAAFFGTAAFFASSAPARSEMTSAAQNAILPNLRSLILASLSRRHRVDGLMATEQQDSAASEITRACGNRPPAPRDSPRVVLRA